MPECISYSKALYTRSNLFKSFEERFMESTLSDGMEPKNVCGVCVCVVCLCVRINSYTYLVKWDGAEEVQKKPRS